MCVCVRDRARVKLETHARGHTTSLGRRQQSTPKHNSAALLLACNHISEATQPATPSPPPASRSTPNRITLMCTPYSRQVRIHVCVWREKAYAADAVISPVCCCCSTGPSSARQFVSLHSILAAMHRVRVLVCACVCNLLVTCLRQVLWHIGICFQEE